MNTNENRFNMASFVQKTSDSLLVNKPAPHVLNFYIFIIYFLCKFAYSLYNVDKVIYQLFP